MAHNLSHHLLQESVVVTASELIRFFLEEDLLDPKSLLQLSSDEQRVLERLLNNFYSASSGELELGAQICERVSNGEDAIGLTAVMLYREAQRRAIKN